MAQFNGLSLTYKGLALQTKAQTGTLLHFSRVAYGDGTLAAGQLLRDLTNLISHKLDLPIVANTVVGNGQSKLRAVCRNQGLAVGFDARELGVFAVDPDEGEILYCVGNAGDFCDYIPAGNGADLIETIIEIITVIKQATNVAATIDTSLLFTTQVESLDHYNSTDPHPNAPSLRAATVTPSHFWGQVDGDNHLHPVSLDAVKAIILGGDAADIPAMKSRQTQTERELSNIALLLEAQQMYPDYNAILTEDFVVPDSIDTFRCAVTSIVAGDNSLDIATLQNIVPGSWYTVTDGVHQEAVQVKSVVKNGSILRVILMADIVATYTVAQTEIYRTTAQLTTGTAQGAGDRRAATWQPATVWQGVAANNPVTTELNTTQGNIGAFTISGDIAFTVDGFITLV